MRIIAHLSDLHFGALAPETVPAVREAVADAKPHLVVISGDLTQRARSHQFAEAKAFLDTLPKPQIVVPGNHDIPLWNVLARGLTPTQKYRRIISDDLEPTYIDDEIAVLGLNTARSLTIKGGRVNEHQARLVHSTFARCPTDVMRIVVTHHPFDDPAPDRDEDIVGRARMAMRAFAAAGVDLVLSGHMHVTRTGDSASRYAGRSSLLVQAGTATSHRQRGEANSFNLLHIDGSKVRIDRLDWDAASGRFGVVSSETFAETEEGWRKVG
jgi:3',5'-cyclic AMP phosphodiesterase CpdA